MAAAALPSYSLNITHPLPGVESIPVDRDSKHQAAVQLIAGTLSLQESLELIFADPRCGVNVQRRDDSFYAASWYRDPQIVLLDGSHLIHDPTISSLRDARALASKAHLYYTSFVGKSDSKLLDKQAKKIQSDLFIEGGNLFFWKEGADTGAIIGSNSVLNSLSKGFPAYVKTMRENEINRFLNLTKEWIAKELRIPVENLIVVEQDAVHIDLELVVGPKRTIFCNDPRATPPLSADEPKDPINPPRSEADLIAMHARNKTLLESKGFTVVSVPGLYRNPARGFFLNGLFLQGQNRSFLISTPACNEAALSEIFPLQGEPATHLLAEQFSDCMKVRNITVLFASPGLRGNLSDLGGGVRCLTRETRKDWSTGIPQAIPIDERFLTPILSTPVEIRYPLNSQPMTLCLETEPVQYVETNVDYLFSYDTNLTATCTVPVPWDGLKFHLANASNRLERIDQITRRLLPGHPHIVQID